MTGGRRRRLLTADERKLWSAVARSVAPLRPGAIRELEPQATPEPPEDPEPAPAPERVPLGASREPPRPPAMPRLAPLDRDTVRALARGRREIEAVLDLHGMRQDEAHAALIGFLLRSQAAGRKVVLVVTGKGGPSGSYMSGTRERGVLRRMVPHWLQLAELRGVVVGFGEAVRHQGGQGALYVRIRRPRGLS